MTSSSQHVLKVERICENYLENRKNGRRSHHQRPKGRNVKPPKISSSLEIVLAQTNGLKINLEIMHKKMQEPGVKSQERRSNGNHQQNRKKKRAKGRRKRFLGNSNGILRGATF